MRIIRIDWSNKKNDVGVGGAVMVRIVYFRNGFGYYCMIQGRMND